MAELEELVKIEITKPLPATGVAGTTYKIEGSVKMFDAIGAPPWVYAEVRRKEWWKPEFIEEVSYERGFPIPVTGTFSIDITPEKKSDYEVTVIATPAPLALPVVGVFPVVGKSDMVKIRVAEPTATDIKNIEISVIGLVFPATDIKNITIGVIGVEFPATDIKNIEIDVIGPEFPATDLKNIAISVLGPAFPSTDIKNIAISVLGPEFPSTDIKNIGIALVAVPVEYKGKISKKELEYNESRGTIPASNVPQDEEGKVHVWGRNDMATNQKLGIHWIVKDPDGIVVEDYEDWESWPNTDPGKTHEFISPGRFDLNKPGTWTIAISLAMNPASPLTIASYAGVLCTVKVATYHLSIFVPTWAYGGYVTPSSGDYPANTTVKLTAHPFSGYQFLGWGRDASGTSPTYNLLMNSDKNVEAYFEKVAEPPTYYPCPYCGATFTTRAALTSHIEKYHPPPPAYSCPYCGATFSSQAALDAHIASAHPPPVYPCPYCGATFSSQAALEAHIASAHPPPVFTCPECGAEFSTAAALFRHMDVAHPPPPVFTCPECGAQFSTAAALFRHMDVAHPPP